MSCRMISPAFCLVLLCVAPGYPAAGQGRSLHSSDSSIQTWKASEEITTGGVIREIVANRSTGAPAGFNFVLSGSQVVDVNAGMNLDPKVREQLRAGETVQVTGLMRSINGKDYLLARELVVGGETIQVRSRNGFPVRGMSGAATAQPRQTQSDLNGGAR
jgi:hypothetical protein